MTHIDDIKEKIASGKDAVIMLGTGFSSAVAEDKNNASWPGLLSAGAKYLDENGLIETPVVLQSIESDINIGNAIDGTFLLSAGQKIASLMHRSTSPHFAAFLRGTVGALKFDRNNAALGQIIEQLNVPVITTNYDTLYEQITQKPSATWQDARKFRLAVNAQSTDVIHLHGIWNDPESIVLTTSDYEKILRDSDTTALRQAIGTLKTIIFVGYGAGLNDAHFQELWNFLKPLLSENLVHYTLCRKKDLAQINKTNADNAIIPVAYGDDYPELNGFLQQLIPPTEAPKNTMEDTRTVIQVAETCRLQILDRLADSTLIPRVIENPTADYVVDDLVVEPLLLPVPPDQFATERTNGNEELQRLNAVNEVMGNSAVVIVGEEQTGVTTALAWSALTRCGISPTHIPVLLDYKQIGQGNKWVQNAVRKHLRASGAPLSNRDALPPNIVIAIDNVTATNERDLRRTIDDINNLGPALALYGCRPGSERLVQQRVQGDDPALIAYLGRLGRRHAIELARRVVPERATSLADRVLRIARKEGLARTPLSILLLIVGVNNDEGWINSVSNTNFIDSFVDSLLGRGAWRDDMHLQIDSGGYSRVLEAFAKKLIEDDSVSAEWLDTVRHIEEIVLNLDWSDNAQDIVRSLITKGIFVLRDGRIQFRQSVYLHIFGARACRSDRELLTKLRGRPLYYAPVIRHYVALQRNDEEVLQWAVDLIPQLEESDAPDHGLYRHMNTDELDRDTKRLEELGNSTDSKQTSQVDSDLEKPEVEDVEDEDTASEHDQRRDEEFDPYENMHDAERPPFPAHDLDIAPDKIRLPALLSLISNVLRDSELVENANLKETGLRRVLSGWGLHMNEVHDSASVHRLIEALVSDIGERLELPTARRDDLSARLKQVWAMVSVAHTVVEELGTIKLERALYRVLGEAANTGRLHMLLPAMLLERALGPVRDYERSSRILIANRDVAGTRIFIDTLLRYDYQTAADGSHDLTSIEKLLIDFQLSLHPDFSGARRGRARSRLMENYRMNRTRNRIRQKLDSPSPTVVTLTSKDAD